MGSANVLINELEKSEMTAKVSGVPKKTLTIISATSNDLVETAKKLYLPIDSLVNEIENEKMKNYAGKNNLEK